MSNGERYEPQSTWRIFREAPLKQKAWTVVAGLGLLGLANAGISTYIEAERELSHKTISHSEKVYTLASQIGALPSLAALIGGAVGVIFTTRYNTLQSDEAEVTKQER